ncbi:MGH1-like glycoside hydrolase domain-containing protein [Paenibacillus sp. y28]|uniref:MGH1-like glycoside hydrolase domain-containing protein n=1 Tax=Paenibacillus sp. y28 TaxID=3129110 RepID=UPI00301980DC
MTTAAYLDEQLHAGRKALRTIPGALLLGSTGARLWADYLDAAPGFSGRFDFIHKINIPLLYTVKCNLADSFEPCHTEWFASHLLMDYSDHRLSLHERKFITWNDCAVSCQTWTNRSGKDLILHLSTYGDAFNERQGAFLHGAFSVPHYSFDLTGVIAVSDSALFDEVVLKPGESRSFIISAALGIAGQDNSDLLQQRASDYATSGLKPEEALARHQEEYGAWFEKAPSFTSSDPVLNKTWLYRWFLLRHNLADPQYGHLTYPLFYEGRSHKKSKRPFDKGGWEFSKLINLSSPLHIMDARWYHDSAYAEGALQNMKASPNEEGMFCCLTVDTVMHSFANFSCWAAYQLYLVHRNREVVEELLPAMKSNVQSWKTAYGNDQDELLTEPKHTRTGKEYQPSYWYFHNYPRNPKDKTTYTHLKRVDRAVYHYLNTLGVAKLCEETGDADAEAFHRQAESIKQDILQKMWDEESDYFYDLHYQTGEKAMVKNIVGIYPGWAQIIEDRFNGMIEHLFKEEEFHTKCTFPSVSADCPAYAPEGGWMGHFVKGRNGCVWDGPTWPYTNSIALDALAKESKRRNHEFDNRFAHYLREYSLLHFMQRDLNQPGLVEHYNSATGEPLSDEQEYNHSYYIDLIVTHVAGLTVEADRIVLDPIDIGLDYFCLDRVKAAGQQLKITYKKPDVTAGPGDLEAGYHIYANGRLVYASDVLGRAELPLHDLSRGAPVNKS